MNEQVQNADPMHDQQPQMQQSMMPQMQYQQPQMQQSMMPPQMQYQQPQMQQSMMPQMQYQQPQMQYQQPQMQQSMMPPQFSQPREGIGAAITSLLCGIILLLIHVLVGIFAYVDYADVVCGFLSIIFMGIAISTGLHALKNTGGRGMAVAGITLALISGPAARFCWTLSFHYGWL